MKRLVMTAGLAAALALPPPQPVEAQQGAMVRGTVFGGDAKPLGGVRILFEHQDGSGKSFELTTKDDGKYIRVGLPAGAYKVTFSKQGYSSGSFNLHFDFGALTEIPEVTLKEVQSQTLPAAPPAAAEGEEPAEPVTLSDAFRRALEATKQGELDEARELYEQIIAVQPDLPEAHYNLGTIHRAQQEWPAAEAAFQKVIGLEPDNADAHSALAAVYEDSGRRDEALELISSTAERFAGDAAFQFNMGVMMLNANRYDLAWEAFQRSVALDPSRVEGLYYLGTLAIGRGSIPEATEHLEKYVAGTGQNERNLDTARRLLETLSKPVQ